ncbi:MAG: phosphate signaling complex protein PhoU [Bacillota bacterium]|jgi:phosphate transport system protein
MMRRLNAYERTLKQIEDELFLMSQKVNRCITTAMQALKRQDEALAAVIVANDDFIDNLDEHVELQSLNLLALQQPTERDLRILAALMRVSRELERINDYACDIAEATLWMRRREVNYQPLDKLQRLGGLTQAMFDKCLAAYNEKDLTAAGQLDDDDQAVDELYEALVAELIGSMKQDSDWVDLGSALLLVARYLERIGDHVVNIAEMTIFAENGERRPFKKQRR